MELTRFFRYACFMSIFVLVGCQSKATPTAAISSDPQALAAVAGTYFYKYEGSGGHLMLRSDGTYATLAGSGNLAATSNHITFVDTLPASGSNCGSQPGIYTWAVDKNLLSLALVKDSCDQRASVLGSNPFERVQDIPNTPVEFVWRMTGAPNTFVRNNQVAVDGQSNIYVLDGGNSRVQVFDSNGKFLMKWGGPGSGDGRFALHSHLHIAVDSPGNVYVSDTDNYRIQKFDSNGKFLLKWGGQGNGEGEFGESTDWGGPESIAVDGQGNVYVADPANSRIEKFDSSGKFLSQFGHYGTADGQFLAAEGLAVDRQGNVYVSDNQQNAGGASNRVIKFDGNGNFVWQWGSTGTDLGMFNYIAGIAVDNQGNIYTESLDYLQKFRPK